MVNLRIVCRAVVYNALDDAILLVRNFDQDWWYAPGGEWDYENEDILECVKREVLEETGISINVIKFLYIQTLFVKEQNRMWLELFWLATPALDKEILIDHIEEFGLVDKSKWFNRSEMDENIIYPEIIKKDFWKDIDSILNEKNRYIGFFQI